MSAPTIQAAPPLTYAQSLLLHDLQTDRWLRPLDLQQPLGVRKSAVLRRLCALGLAEKRQRRLCADGERGSLEYRATAAGKRRLAEDDAAYRADHSRHGCPCEGCEECEG